MKNGQCFRVTRSAMAVAQQDSRNVPIMVPEGAIIEVVSGPFDHGLMDVRYDGELRMMFTNDMENHTDQVDKAETA